ncbi:MAG: HDOD domain-containing protein [Treponema sp.]|nr:HDOD domain-containing protein [Candidatus Treponema caballi]
MSDSSRIQVDPSKIRRAVQSNIPLSITTYTLPHEMEIYMADVLTAFLKELNQEHMTEYLVYCMNELTTNAKKANTKRIYFQEKHLDINDPKDYEMGMKTFKVDTLENLKHYLSLQKASNYYIKLILQAKNGKICLEVRNHTELTVFEYKRIHDKLSRAQQYTSIDEAFAQILDDSEGAGLGLIIMILMLQKIGLAENNYQVFSENGETISRIILPLNKRTQEDITEMSKDIVTEIDSLPQFPDNIARIQSMLSDPAVDFQEVAHEISNDVSLTTDLLRHVNSAAFSLPTPCLSILDAVKLVGIRGLRNLLYSVGSLKTLQDSSNAKKDLWDHSYQVAAFSSLVAKAYFRSNRQVTDDSYVCGLLHDVGKVVFENVHPELMDKYRSHCSEKQMKNELFEKITSGANHAEIGAQITEKWNFPKVISLTIRYHHNPELAPADVKSIATVVYFAEMLTHYLDGSVEFYQFDEGILNAFGIKDEDKLKALVEKLQTELTKER